MQVTTAGVWTYTLDNGNADVNALSSGGSLSDTFTVESEDGTDQVITITINGTNDAAVITGSFISSISESNINATSTISGNLDHTDVDGNNVDDVWEVVASTTESTNAYGTYSVTTSGVWEYVLDNTNATIDALGSGQSVTDTITLTAEDGTAQDITITINGTNDAAVITGVFTSSISTNDNLTSTISGNLDHTDVDGNNADDLWEVVSSTTDSVNAYGTYSVTESGGWEYVLDNTNTAINALRAGQSVTDTITLTTEDGTTQDITITINGENDAAIIAGATTGSVTEVDGSSGTTTTTGTLTHTDVDNTNNLFTVITSGSSTYGTYAITTAGVWTYTLDNGNADVNALSSGGSLSDTFTVESEDGTDQVITITINGTNDAAVITGSFTSSISESNINATSTISGNLDHTDVDGNNVDDVWEVVASTTESTNSYGTYSVTTSGVWEYVLD